MNPLRQLIADWLFGFGQPVPDNYVPPVAAPVPAVVPPPAVVAPLVPDPQVGPRCIVCPQPLGKSPSDFFCSDACQRAWDGRQADLLPSHVQLPDGTLLNPTRRVG